MSGWGGVWMGWKGAVVGGRAIHAVPIAQPVTEHVLNLCSVDGKRPLLLCGKRGST